MAQPEALANALENAIKAVENQVDEELEKLKNPEEDELSRIRNLRISEYKKKQKDQEKYRALGHGEYTEIPSEKDFFPVANKSERVVAHFYRPSAFRCSILDKHFGLLAPKHIETKFLKLNAEKSPFLTEKLNIKVLPTILIIINGQVKDRVVGFTDLGNCDDFGTEMLEWRLSLHDAIEYSGDKSTPPDPRKPKKSTMTLITKKGIRSKKDDSSDDDDE